MSEFKCAYCGEVFADEAALYGHTAAGHIAPPKKEATERKAVPSEEFDFSRYEIPVPEKSENREPKPGKNTRPSVGASLPRRIRKKNKHRLALTPAVKKKALLCLLTAAAAVLLTVLFIVPNSRIASSKKYYEAGDYVSAMDRLSGSIRGKKAFETFGNAATAYGDRCLEDGDEISAAISYTKACRADEAEQIFDFNSIVMGYSYVTAGISRLGNAYYVTNREGDSQEEGLAAVCGMQRFLPSTAGINGTDPDGCPVFHPLDSTAKLYLSEEALAEFEKITDIKDAISDTDPENGHFYVAVLRENGTVSVISDGPSPLTPTASWKKITRIEDGCNKIFGIDYAGKLHIAYEKNADKNDRYDIGGLSAVRKVVETGKAVIVLTVSGELKVFYGNTDYRYDYDFSAAENVADITADNNILVISFRDGTAKAIRIPNWISDQQNDEHDKLDRAIRAVSHWKNIVRVRFAANGIYGIRCDGKVCFTSCDIRYDQMKNKYVFNAQRGVARKVSGWTDIVDIISCTTHAIAIRYDGTAVSTGNTEYMVKKLTTPTSDTYSYAKKSDGIYADVSEWKLW